MEEQKIPAQKIPADGRSKINYLTEAEQSVFVACTQPLLDLSLVHQKAIPGIWNQVRFTTFPCNWLVIGHLPGDMRDKMVLQGEGPGGVEEAVRHLRDDEVQYAGFRVTITMDASIMSDVDEPEDVFVLVRWVGKHTSPQQRSNVQKEMDFMTMYFHDHTLALEMMDHDVVLTANQVVDRVQSLTAHVKQLVMRQVQQRTPVSQAQALQFDFANATHVSECTHYDTVEPYETADKSNAAMTHDALFNAMTELQKTEDSEVPYYEEAKERYADHLAEKEEANGEHKAEQGEQKDVVPETQQKPTKADMEGEHLQYQYNTFDLDHGEEAVGLHGKKVEGGTDSSEGGVAAAAVVSSSPPPPPAPSTSWVPTNLDSTNQVPADETDMLVLERLKVEEESLLLRRQLAAMQQEIDRQSSKQRIQERLKARREAKEKKKGGAAAAAAATTTTTAETDAPASGFFQDLDARGKSARDRTAARVATRSAGAGEQKQEKRDATNQDQTIAMILAERQKAMATKLKDVEARIQLNNDAISAQQHVGVKK